MKYSSPVAIDHLLTYVTTLERAADLFSRMGFRLSPVSRIDTMGVSNQLILMRPGTPGRANYIELMTPHDRSKLPASMASVLSGAEAIGSMVLLAPAIETLPALLADIGFAPPQLARVRREWVIPGEASVYPQFDVMLPIEAPLRFNACRYDNVELYLRDEWLDHPNGARRLSATYAVAQQPRDFLYFDRILGVPAQALPDDGLCWRAGDVRLEILTPAGAMRLFDIDHITQRHPQYLGYEIEVSDIASLRARFDRERVPYRIGATGRIHIAPDDGLGNYIVFAPADPD